MTQERAYWLAWAQISGIGPVLLQRLQQHFGTLAAAWEAPKAKLGEVEGFGYQTVVKVQEVRSRLQPEEFLAQHLEKNPDFWTPADAEYPRLLLEIPSPPPVLYYRGEVEATENLGTKPLVGIVGTRKPTEYGIRWTRQISTALARNGFTVVSGLAEGIDTETHNTTLKAGGRTIAVLGTGVDVIYPAKNRELYQRILLQGFVLSEYSAKTPPNRTHFPRRNRIIAGLCRAVLVMEAPQQSGALITARYATEFNRDVYALPGRIDDNSSQGCLRLISQGAEIILPELDELLRKLGAIPQLDGVEVGEKGAGELLAGGRGIRQWDTVEESVRPNLSPDLSPDLQRVMDAIALESVQFDFIVQQTGLPAAIVSSSLLQLELMGLVSQLPGMRYQRC